MKKFTYVEDYIEVIGGFRDPQTGKTANHSLLWFSFTPLINLARYDVNVLESMCDSVIDNKALTARQGELALKIITKYTRQLAQKEVDVSPVLDPQWRLPLRIMDYSKKMYIENDTIMLEFPFNNSLIEGLREFRKDSQGKGEWDKEKRRWEYALTEYNLSYLITWAQANQFEIDDESNKLNAIITAVEQIPFAIELEFEGNLRIKNASNSLTEYINEQCGGFGIDNLAKLVDMSSILGYTLSDSIYNAWCQEHGKMNAFLSTHNEVKLSSEQYHLIDDVLNYADNTQRWPVVIYEPDTTNRMLKDILKVRDRTMIHQHRGSHSIDMSQLPAGVKYIHTTVPIKNQSIPLLVSTAGMMFGGDKSLMLQNAEKSIFFAADVHTNKKNHKVAEFASEISNQG